MDLTKWIQNDINPFIIFSNKGKILYLNDEAEYFLTFVNEKEIFEFAINNANTQKGIFTTFKEYKFDKFEFSAVSIGYEDDEKIGIKLYKVLTPVKSKTIDGLEKINIFFIYDFCRNYIFLDEKIEFIDEFDIDIPEFYSNKDKLIKILNEIFSKCNSKKIKTIIKYEIGEKLKVNNQIYGVISIEIFAKFNELNQDSTLFTIIQTKNSIKILIPFIKKI